MINWNEKSIEWYLRSGMIEPYAKDIVYSIKDYIIDKDVIDAGCGIGVTSYFLAKYAKSVLAVDNQERPLDFAKEYFKDEEKITFKNCDIFDLEKKSSDVLLAISVGQLVDMNMEVLDIARNYTILVSPVEREVIPKKPCCAGDEDILKENNIKYKKLYVETCFGQHYKSMEDFEEFIKEYNMEDIREDALKNLIEIKGEYPLYLKNKKKLRVLIIERKNV